MSRENARRILVRDPTPHLFRPLTVRSVKTPNRIMMSPMCQYSAEDGLAGDWHFVHLAARAVGGAGIVCVEACHVEARGRITKHCLGLWNDEQRDRLARIAAFVSSQGAVRDLCRDLGRERSRCPRRMVRGRRSALRQFLLATVRLRCARSTKR